MGLRVKEHSLGVYFVEEGSQWFLATRSISPGRKIYGEKLVDVEGAEYRLWNPTHSKLGAAIIKGLKINPIKPGAKVLYLGVASGTTCSHVSDIVGDTGHVWGVDFSPRPLRDLIDNVVKYRDNISPILADARQPQTYGFQVQNADVIFADVAQPDQADIVIKNAKLFLRKGGNIMLSIKSRSIDVGKIPEAVYSTQIEILKKAGFSIEETLELDPYEIDHALVLAKYV